MPHYDERLRGLEDRLRSDDPEFADGFGRGAPRVPREYRYGYAWLWLTVGLVGLVTGIVIGHGLLIAAALVVAGIAGQLFDPQRSSRRSRVQRSH